MLTGSDNTGGNRMTYLKRALALAVGLSVAALLALFSGTGTAQASTTPSSHGHTEAAGAPTGGAAPNTRRITCDPNIPYLRIFNNTGVLCFADAGTLFVDIQGVTRLEAGANAGFVAAGRSGEITQNYVFQKGHAINFSPPVRVTQITIN
jgi:Beta/Gamma crystallin